MSGKLKPLDVDRETRPGKYPDGDGLYLVVASATSKNWSYRYWKDGKQRWLGLGSFKDVSLKEARLARDAARRSAASNQSICPATSCESFLRPPPGRWKSAAIAFRPDSSALLSTILIPSSTNKR